MLFSHSGSSTFFCDSFATGSSGFFFVEQPSLDIAFIRHYPNTPIPHHLFFWKVYLALLSHANAYSCTHISNTWQFEYYLKLVKIYKTEITDKAALKFISKKPCTAIWVKPAKVDLSVGRQKWSRIRWLLGIPEKWYINTATRCRWCTN